MIEATNKALIRRWFDDVWNKGQEATIDKLLAINVEGTHQGGALGIPPTGRRIRVGGMVLTRISECQIVEAWNSWDQLGFLRQIDAIPTPAGGDRFVGAHA